MTALVLSLLLGASSAADDKPIVMVAPFRVESTDPELQQVGKGFADMVAGDLVAWDGVTVVDRERVQDAIAELKLQRTKYFDPKTRLKIGKFLGARYLIGGTMVTKGQALNIQASVLDLVTSQQKAEARVQGRSDDVFDLEQELVNKLTASIDARVRDAGGRRKVRVPTLAALADYGKALDLSDQGNVEEASKAFAALVSKAPTFGLARDRKAEIIKKLADLAERRKDMVTASVLAVSKEADLTLEKERGFDRLPEDQQRHFLAMRQLKGRVILRTLKQHLSSHDRSLRVVSKGHEAQALTLMRTWLGNQRSLLDELDRFTRQRGSVTQGRRYAPSMSYSPDETLARQLKESGLGEVSLGGLPFEELFRFVMTGWGRDGEESFRVAPALGDLEPKTAEAVLGELDKRVAAAVAAEKARLGGGEHDFTRLLELKAEYLIRNDRIDDAVGAYQQILDNAPQGYRASWVEGRIKQILEGHDNNLDDRERWEKALKGCDDMDIRTGLRSTDRYVWRQGLAGIQTIATTLEKACLGKPKTDRAMEYMYQHLALDAGRYGDCDTAVRFFRRSLEMGGSESDMRGYNKNYIPWCDLSGITKATLPSSMRVTIPGLMHLNSDEQRVSRVASALVTDELIARSIGIAPENRTRGDTRWLWVAIDLERKVPYLWVKLLKNGDDEEGVELEVPLVNGRFDLDAVLNPVIAKLRPGTRIRDDKPHAALPMELVEGLAEVAALGSKKKFDEALQKLAPLEKKYGDFHLVHDARETVEKQQAKQRK